VKSRWLTTRQLAIVAIFSGLWAALEITVGTLLVVTKVPFRGAILTAIALGLVIIVRRLVPKKGTALAMGVIVAAIRIIMGGPKVLTIAPALVIEGALIEMAFLVTADRLSQIRMPSCALAGTLSVSYSLLHNILMVGLVSGLKKQHFSAVIDYLEGWKFGLPSLWIALLLLVIFRALLGAAAGMIWWYLTHSLQIRNSNHIFPPEKKSEKPGTFISDSG
jgi:ABC-type thiamin/hydroxymethylpyrimidine transport system permease subunit